MSLLRIFSTIVKKISNVWEVRVMVLVSVCLQIILIIFGSQRKHIAKTWINVLVWSAYLSADWVATVTLGYLATNRADSFKREAHSNENNIIQTFWAPFLLLHLGGPDSITAYSLQDNELWLRHFVGLLLQVGVAVYVFLKAWGHTALSFVTIPVFISGIIKYGERTWVLRCSSADQVRDSLLSVSTSRYRKGDKVFNKSGDNDAKEFILQANHLFESTKYLFADVLLEFDQHVECHAIIRGKSAEEAFKLVAAELGFMYDLLYTKARIAFSKRGIILRCISFMSSVSALVAFFAFGFTDDRAYPVTDRIISTWLLVAAVSLEIYSFMTLILSNWTKVWLAKLPRATCFYPSCLTKRKNWSGSMVQLNLITICVKAKPADCVWILNLFGFYEKLKNYRLRNWIAVSVDLQRLIFSQLQHKADEIRRNIFEIKSCSKFLAQRGDYVLERHKCFNEFRWATIDVEFDHSLLLWHIATDLCYHVEDAEENNSGREISKWISDYMLYLLVMRPSMLPKGISDIRYRDTCAVAVNFFEQRKDVISYDASKACKELLQVNSYELGVEELREGRNKSVLSYGRKLADQLKNHEKKWKLMSEVWVEILVYSASHCGWKEHSQQLRNGGELLTHVRLLMAHLGLSEQYRWDEPYVPWF